jgi:hypothetical protein
VVEPSVGPGLWVYTYTGYLLTHMAAGGLYTGSIPRLDSALLAKWPEQLDIVTDIFVPGKTETFKAQLVAALASRHLLFVVHQRPPTMQSIASQNPDADGAEVQEAYDNLMHVRQNATTNLALLLPQLIKPTSMTYQQAADMNAHVMKQDGIAIHDFIQGSIDLRQGIVQDKLRQKYAAMKLSPSDSITVVKQQIDLKWFLHRHNTLYDVSVVSGRREGIRSLLTMLLDGPGNIATEAIFSLASVEAMDLQQPNSAEEWVRTRMQSYDRYGEQLVGRSRGQTHT